MFVEDFMNTNSVVCTEDLPLIQVYQRMLENNCDFICVIDGNAHKIPIGIITEHDICLITIAKGRHPKDLTARDVMSPKFTKAKRKLDLMDCHDLMDSCHTKILMIVDERGGLCGTVSQLDIESSKNNQYFENLMSQAMAKEYLPSMTRINRIF
jgi:CBS domain-containing protein